jgi:1-acyl-sn-glycerol-3-phosphate acyltransferase
LSSALQLDPGLKRVVLSVAIWTSIFLMTIMLFLVMLATTAITLPFDKRRKLQHSLCYWWSDAVIHMNPYWRVEVQGLENIDKDRTYVAVANHQSMADIVLLFQTRMQFKWIAKDSLFRIPFLGWCLSLAGHVRLARNKVSSIRRAYREASVWIDNGVSMMFFPEGTRSDTGEVGAFHAGAFKLARKKKVAVLPIAIQGTARAMPKGAWMFTPEGTISMTVLPCLEPDDFQTHDMGRFMNIAREIIQRA